MARKVEITLIGKNGTRSIEVEQRGLLTRHVKAPREAVPSLFGDVSIKPKAEPVRPPIDTELILNVMRNMENRWLIIDEVLYVGNIRFSLALNHKTLKMAFDELVEQGSVETKVNRFGQDCYRLKQKQTLKELLNEADAILAGGAE